MPRADRVRPKRNGQRWRAAKEMPAHVRPIVRGWSFVEPDLEQVKREAVEARELMKEAESGN